MNIHLWTFIFQIVNFVVVAFVLHRLLYRPLHEAIERRRQATLDAQTQAEHAQHEAEALQGRLEAELADVERQRAEQLGDAQQLAAAERERLLAEAQQTAQQLAEEARRELAEQREAALAEVSLEIVQLAADLARRFLSQAADRTLQRQLVARLVGTLASAPAEDRKQLLIGWQPGDPAVLETAEELDGESLQALSNAVATLIGKTVDLQVKLNPALISGVCLQLGGHIWDASLNGSLEELREPESNAQEAAHA